jgi:hypothetical protein
LVGIFVFTTNYISGKKPTSILFIFQVVKACLYMLKTHYQPILKSTLLLASMGLILSCKKEEPIDLRITTLSKEEIAVQAEAARNSVTPVLAEGLKLEVWGVDSLVRDPIAIHVSDDGSIYYSRSPRRNNAEFDIRGHQDWEIRSIALQTIEDKRNFLRTELSPERSWLTRLERHDCRKKRGLSIERL